MTAQDQKIEGNPFSNRKYHTGTGRRKSAVASAKIYTRGKGRFLINHRELKDYFNESLVEVAKESLVEVGKVSDIDVGIRVSGGGPAGQAEAVRLAIARALVAQNEDYKPALRKAGYLTVDARVKERKKPGLKRARRAPQWSKR